MLTDSKHRLTAHQKRLLDALKLGPAKMVTNRSYRALDGKLYASRTVRKLNFGDFLNVHHYSTKSWLVLPDWPVQSGYEIFKGEAR